MVEPQDPNRYHSMMNKQEEAVLAIAKLNQSLPEEFNEEAKKSLEALVSFRAELKTDIADLQKKADGIKEKLADKIHQEGLQRGFLMSPLAEYEKFLNFDTTGLQTLLDEDEQIWTMNLREAEERAKLAQGRIQDFLEKQQQDLLKFLKQNELTTINRTSLKLRRLPLWGVGNNVTFEWPTEAEVAKYRVKKMPPLKEINFWFRDSNTVCMRAVQFTHMDGELSSPLFDTGDPINCKIKIDRDVLKETTEVSACCRDTQHDSIKSITFRNMKDQVGEVNHYRREIGMQLSTHKLEPGEEIIGGYGNHNTQRFITCFGFIVARLNPI